MGFDESKMIDDFHDGSKVAKEPRVDFLSHCMALILIKA